MSPEEEERLFVAKYQPLKSGLYKLPATWDFGCILEQLVAARASSICLAFDYDQTLHLRESHRGRSLQLLRRLQSLGIPFCIVTAAQPRIGSVKALAEELQELNLDPFFRTTQLDPTVALARIGERFPDNSMLSLEDLELKLMLLLALCTDRRPSDLVRIGHSNAIVSKDEAVYRLQRGLADWSAELTLEINLHHSDICPVRTLAAFLERIAPNRPPPVYREIDLEKDMPDPIVETDHLFLMNVAQCEACIENFLLSTNAYPAWQIDGLMREPAVEHNINGIQMARYGNLICAKYNKAEAVEWFMQELDGVTESIFVDDNFDNVINVFGRFAELEKSRGLIGHSVWFEEPLDGRPEKYNARRVELGALIMRPLCQKTASDSSSAFVDFGAMGKVQLNQIDSLSEMQLELDSLIDGAEIYFSDTDLSVPWNPSGRPLLAAERPGCTGARFTNGKATSCAWSLCGPLSVVAKHAVLVIDGVQKASGPVEPK